MSEPIIHVRINGLNCPTIYLITGVSGSGKTTYALKLKEERGIKYHYEADMWMVNGIGSYYFDYRRLEYCHLQCFNATEKALLNFEDVIVSNTFLTKKEVNPYIQAAVKNDYNIVLVHLTTQFNSIHQVPAEKIQQMKNKRELFVI